MKILVISNWYPPHDTRSHVAGCRDVVEKLTGRGHRVRVLAGDCVTEQGVDLLPAPETGPDAETRGMVREYRVFRDTADEFSPDVVYFWNHPGHSRWLPVFARLMGLCCAFFISDMSYAEWRVGAVLSGWLGREPRTRIGRLAQWMARAALGWTWLVKGYPVTAGQPCHFVSAFLLNCGYRDGINTSDTHTAVIPWGIEVKEFAGNMPPEQRPRRKLLYVGQLIPQKGVHTAVEALATLAKTPEFADMSLTIVGGGPNTEYEERLRALPTNLGVSEKVVFPGNVPREEMPAIYRAHDVLVFPSVIDEPLAVTPLEAMAAKLPVAGTTTGGSGEIFRERETAMTFEAGNAALCAAAVAELCTNTSLYESIRSRAYLRVAADYTLEGMVDRIEASLRAIVDEGNAL